MCNSDMDSCHIQMVASEDIAEHTQRLFISYGDIQNTKTSVNILYSRHVISVYGSKDTYLMPLSTQFK